MRLSYASGNDGTSAETRQINCQVADDDVGDTSPRAYPDRWEGGLAGALEHSSCICPGTARMRKAEHPRHTTVTGTRTQCRMATNGCLLQRTTSGLITIIRQLVAPSAGVGL